MNVRSIKILGYTFRIEDKELKDPVYRNIRGVNKRKKW